MYHQVQDSLVKARATTTTGDTTNSDVSPGPVEGYFNVRAGHNLDAAQESNQHTFSSPGPGPAFCRQPIVLLENKR
jgi:hypothetical protein